MYIFPGFITHCYEVFTDSFNHIAGCFSSCSQKQAADTIYINAEIWTGDSSQPYANSIAIRENKIIYTGDEYSKYKGERTKLVDCAVK